MVGPLYRETCTIIIHNDNTWSNNNSIMDQNIYGNFHIFLDTDYA